MALQQQTNADFSLESARSYIFSGSASRAGTDSARQKDKSSILRVVPNCQTQDALIEGAKRLKITPAVESTVHSGTDVQKFVKGVVSQYDDVTVRCDLRVNDSAISVQLPRSLFPQSIRFGLPIRLEMIDDNGIRRPKIFVREIDAGDVANVISEFDSILAAI